MDNIKRECSVCKADISHKRKGSIFCGKKCNQINYNKRHNRLPVEQSEEILNTENGYIKQTFLAKRIIRKAYYNNANQLHNPDGPAFLHYNKSGKVTVEFYFLNGKRQESPGYKPKFCHDGSRKA